jgi:hypothetical protein
MTRPIRVLAALALAAPFVAPPAAFAGPYDQPYGLIESGDRSPTRKQEPVAISRIDGQTTRNPRRPDPVAPGWHSVGVSFASARVVGDQSKTIEIEVQPCKRYRVAAAYQTTVGGKWEPVVAATEDIGECRRKFMQDGAKK